MENSGNRQSTTTLRRYLENNTLTQSYYNNVMHPIDYWRLGLKGNVNSKL